MAWFRREIAGLPRAVWRAGLWFVFSISLLIFGLAVSTWGSGRPYAFVGLPADLTATPNYILSATDHVTPTAPWEVGRGLDAVISEGRGRLSLSICREDGYVGLPASIYRVHTSVPPAVELEHVNDGELEAWKFAVPTTWYIAVIGGATVLLLCLIALGGSVRERRESVAEAALGR